MTLVGTMNPFVWDDLLDIAIAMPAEFGARIIPEAIAWLASPHQRRIADKIGKLMAHLAAADEVDASLILAAELLELRRSDEASGGVVARMDVYAYKEMLLTNVPVLVKADGERMLTLLCAILEKSLCADRGRSEKPHDLSCLWRPAIEDHEQNWEHDPRTFLVTAVRDAAVQIVSTDRLPIRQILEMFDGRQWTIFRRLGLYLLSRFPAMALDAVSERLGNQTLFDDHALQHEYALLGRAGFPLLDPQVQDIIMGWIEAGPNDAKVESHEKTWEQRTGKSLSEDDIRRYVQYWQATRLAWFKGVLPPRWQKMYERLAAELGEEPEHPDLASYHFTGSIKQESPKSAQELRAMSEEELTSFLAGWEPPHNKRQRLGEESPDRDCLGREFSRAIAADPGHFVSMARSVADRAPMFVPSLLSGLLDAARQDRSLDWPLVLNVCRWVIEERPAVAVADGTFGERFPDWERARIVVVELIEAGLKKDPPDLPGELREQVWTVLRALTDDPQPTPEYEAKYGGSNMGPLTLSINTIRGKALHAVVRYALWVRKHIANEANSAKRLTRGFDEMPEVRTVLDRHLDPAQDPSLAVRAVYGQWFPWLWFLDKGWAVQHVADIFPPDEQERERWQAAWHTYVVYDQAFNNMLLVLHNEYARAIERIGEAGSKSGDLENPDVRLGDHLLMYYCRGLLHGDDLLDRYFEQAPAATSGRAMANLGHSFASTEGEIAADVVARVTELVDRRIEAVESRQAGARPEELREYGWFLAADVFDKDWALSKLIKVTALVGKVEPDHMIYERLAALVDERPLEVVNCLSAMVEVEKEGWGLLGSKEEIRSILKSVVSGANVAAREQAIAIINRLGERGYLEYRDLLSSQRKSNRI
jgi:hypothetical protein